MVAAWVGVSIFILVPAWLIAWPPASSKVSAAPFSARWDPLATLVMFALFIGSWATLVWVPLTTILTRFDRDGISFLTARGRRYVRWEEVTRLEVEWLAIAVTGGGRTYRIGIALVKGGEDLARAITARVPPGAIVALDGG